jgi:hypothetical protein
MNATNQAFHINQILQKGRMLRVKSSFCVQFFIDKLGMFDGVDKKRRLLGIWIYELQLAQ